ncbi:MAG: hypothetical protein M1832_006235 [Thelocarpon impressellum]|nr:MAG: hypothetical protein M1832_006235 [Thelocarpon impressellum]
MHLSCLRVLFVSFPLLTLAASLINHALLSPEASQLSSSSVREHGVLDRQGYSPLSRIAVAPSRRASAAIERREPALGVRREACLAASTRHLHVATRRLDGVFHSFEVVAARSVKAFSLGSVLLAPLFVLLEFNSGNWVGGAFAAAGLIAGVPALFSLGPVGWLTGAVAAWITILPTLWQQEAQIWPEADKPEQLIQYALFGDPKVTGNEKCREGAEGRPGNPNCTVQYGPGVLARAFGWDNFDPVVFMIRYNEGYAMAVPDMAKAFCVAPASPLYGECKDAIATVRCHNRRPCNMYSCDMVSDRWCMAPTFELRRDLITLPVLNQTADRVYERIIPKPGGDCKLVTDMTDRQLPRYNISLSGMPVAVACNLSDESDSPGARGNGTGGGVSGVARASSTDQIDHTAPDVGIAEFSDRAMNPANSFCLGTSDGQRLCLPTGTYQTQSGRFSFEGRNVDNLSMPANATLNVTLVNGMLGRMFLPYGLRFTQNQTDADQNFSSTMRRVATQTGYESKYNLMTATIPCPAPPVVCLFTKPRYMGDVACFGPGANNLTHPAGEAAQSLKLHGGVDVWAWPRHYGDSGGQRIAHDYDDLAAISDGVSGNFANSIRALLIREAGGARLATDASASRGAPNGNESATNTDTSNDEAAWSLGGLNATAEQWQAMYADPTLPNASLADPYLDLLRLAVAGTNGSIWTDGHTNLSAAELLAGAGPATNGTVVDHPFNELQPRSRIASFGGEV